MIEWMYRTSHRSTVSAERSPVFRARSKISMSFATASPSNAVDWVAEPAWAVYALIVLGTAALLLLGLVGVPYLWGGRSARGR